MFIYLKTTMLRYVTYDSRYLLDNYDYKVTTETKLMRVLPLRQQSVLVWAYPREMKLNSENFKIALVEPRWCCYGNIDVSILLRI